MPISGVRTLTTRSQPLSQLKTVLVDKTHANKFLVPGSKPPRPAFVVTDGKWDKQSKAYVEIDPMKVSMDMLVRGTTKMALGKLTFKPNMLWVSCLHPSCQTADKNTGRAKCIPVQVQSAGSCN